MTFIEKQAQREYGAGEVVFREKEEGSSMFIVTAGELEVSTTSKEGGRVVLAKLEKGAIFGEMSLIDGRPRSATVTAVRDSKCLEISRMLFRKNLEAMPGWMRSFFQILTERLREANRHVNPLTHMDVSRQVVFLINQQVAHTEPDLLDHVSVPWKKTAGEISFVINRPQEEVDKVMNKMSLTDLAKSEMNFEQGRQFVVQDVQSFTQFAEYCKARYVESRGGELPPQYARRSEREQAILKFLDDLLHSQGRENEVEYQFFESRLEEELGDPIDSYKHEFVALRKMRIIESRMNAADEKIYVIDRERLHTILAMEETVAEFTAIEEKL